MGRYATTTSISELLPYFLTSDTTSADSRGTAIFSRAIVQAEARVNAAIAARYNPGSFTSTAMPPILIQLTEELACYFAIRAAYTQDGQSKNEYMNDFKGALETLKKIEDGDIKLTYTDGSIVPVQSSNRFLSSSENYTPVFGLDTATAWKVDSDQLSDQSSARD